MDRSAADAVWSRSSPAPASAPKLGEGEAGKSPQHGHRGGHQPWWGWQREAPLPPPPSRQVPNHARRNPRSYTKPGGRDMASEMMSCENRVIIFRKGYVEVIKFNPSHKQGQQQRQGSSTVPVIFTYLQGWRPHSAPGIPGNKVLLDQGTTTPSVSPRRTWWRYFPVPKWASVPPRDATPSHSLEAQNREGSVQILTGFKYRQTFTILQSVC